MNRPVCLAFASLTLGTPLAGQAPAPIQDNSFLIEEAYNQEAGVIQHINAFLRSRDGSWWYTFTQEWPVFGQRSQLSYTVPVLHAGTATGIGDVALDYRLQAAGPAGRVAFSPRLSLLLPTGSYDAGRGSGAAGGQVNLPLSVRVARRVVTHWNAGATWTPQARNASGDKANTVSYALGASAIVEVTPSVNVLLEVVWARIVEVIAPDRTAATEEAFVNPGIRWAHTFTNGLQIVPGIGVPIGLGRSRSDRGVFVYLSFEHPI